jgi:hypothetical protein
VGAALKIPSHHAGNIVDDKTQSIVVGYIGIAHRGVLLVVNRGLEETYCKHAN